MLNDTICAPATPPINSPLGIIRISGSESLRVVNSIFNYPEKIKPRYVVYGSIIDNNEIIDDVVLVFYQNPQSFTGEDMVDIFCHGNPIIVKKIINLIIRNGAVMAEPGEFSKRAFINGKIDLTAAEAINQVITARSEWEISSSIRQMHGSLRDVVNEIKSRLILLKADIEAGIDFLEEDIEFISEADAITQLDDIRIQLDNLLQRCRIGEKISHGIDIPIIGKPNVGKSSILNLILNSERAIVSNIPGTTRDLINETIQFAGIRTNLFDTAGIDKPTNEIERKGIELSQQKIDSSSIIIMVFDAYLGINNEDKAILEKINNKKKIILANKIDLTTKDVAEKYKDIVGQNIILFSAKTGEGLADLEKEISNIYKHELVDYENSFVADIRIVNKLEASIVKIQDCKRLLTHKEPLEVISFELQILIDTLSEITGEISPDDVLNSIFSRFCIGK